MEDHRRPDRQKMIYWIVGWGIVGVVIPLMMLALHQLGLRSSLFPDYLVVFLWPTSIATLALERVSTLMAGLVIIISIAINAGVYMAIGGFLWWMRHLCR